jgi:hypothetical protein
MQAICYKVLDPESMRNSKTRKLVIPLALKPLALCPAIMANGATSLEES